MMYLNHNIVFEINSEIIEYDIKSANVSLCREFNLLPTQLIDEIANLPKENRVIRIGKIMRKNPEFSKALERSFNDVVKRFIQDNALKESDVISIKKDAVFVINKEIKNPKVGTFVNFEKKNIYHAYLYLKPYEFYFKKDGTVDVKGKATESLPYHYNGILAILKELVYVCERHGASKSVLNNFMWKIVSDYKLGFLPSDCFRNFSNDSFETPYGVEFSDVDESHLLDLEVDKSYNYMHIILPLYRQLCQ